MATKTIEAALRIALQVSEAIAGLKAFRSELKGAKADAAGITGGGSGAGGGSTPGAAARTDTDELVRQVKRRGQAEREAVAEAKRLAKEKLEAERAALREARRLREEEDKRRRKEDIERKREQKAAADADLKAKRNQAYKAAQLAPQLTDITVGLATGQNPITLALQQGGQLKGIYGGVMPALRAVMGVLTPLRVGVLGAAGAVATLAVQFAAGYRESSQLRKELALTGNAGNFSAAQIDANAKAIAAQQTASVAFARELQAGLRGVAGQTDQTLGATARAAAQIARLTGETADETVKVFTDQAAGVTNWAIKSNKAYNFLTAEQVRYIRSLERQGAIAQAVKFTNEQLAASLEQRGTPAIGSLERAWNRAGQALANFKEKLKSIGRDEEPEQRLARLKTELAEIQARLAQPTTPGRSRAFDLAAEKRLQAEIAAASGTVNRDGLRKSERAIALREEADRITKLSKEYQDILAQQDQATAQQRLARRMAELDAEQAVIERAYAQQVESALSRDLKLNRIDQERAREQEALAQAELNREAWRQDKRNPNNTNQTIQDVEQGKVLLLGLESRLTEARARTAAAVAEGRRLIDAEITRLNEDIQARAAENARADIPKVVADPAARAQQAAMAETDSLRRELRDLQRDLAAARAVTGPGSAALVDRLQRQVNEAAQTLAESTRRAELQSLLQQASEQLTALSLAEQRLDQLVEQGATTTAEAEAKKLKLRRENLEVLQQIEALVRKRASSPEERNSAGQLKNEVLGLSDAATELEKTFRSASKSGLADFFKDLETGSSSALEAFKKLTRGIASALLDLINKRMSEQLFISLFGDGKPGSSNPLAEFFSALFAPVKHTGGLIGESGLARAVSPLVFSGAQILHSGGLVGLRANEVPVIAEKGEEMLTADDPRHIKNFKGFGDVNITTSVTVNGAVGSDAEIRAQVGDLDRRMRSVVEQWAADQRRQGGVLAKR